MSLIFRITFSVHHSSIQDRSAVLPDWHLANDPTGIDSSTLVAPVDTQLDVIYPLIYIIHAASTFFMKKKTLNDHDDEIQWLG